MDVAGKLDTPQLQRDMRELAWAILYEQRYTPDEILEFYLNTAAYGERVYGVEAAAQYYFGKPVNDLNLAECAMIAALGRYPYAGDGDWEWARKAQTTILKLMVEDGYINAQAADVAAREELVLIHQNE